ncbi:hypothetical protein PoB_004363400 [Plakobranchus ocellatus]|uniref:Uncharacterized protein n=1 Tax=Plakobranchus ocellatus TaxID=259542 RepID=A0AAV4BFK2_9GAST|nr:hypothetical protein PoB_004363400 [Plakobranchus ocellatus]
MYILILDLQHHPDGPHSIPGEIRHLGKDANPSATKALIYRRNYGGFGGTVVSESALRSAGTLLSRIQAALWAPWPARGPKSPRPPCC